MRHSRVIMKVKLMCSLDCCPYIHLYGSQSKFYVYNYILNFILYTILIYDYIHNINYVIYIV